MRISGGSARGRIVNAPKGVELRPTEERVRQALFNICAPLLPGCRFLDLFCGTGAVGLEALSRGAAFACFADRETRCLKSAEEHLKAFGFAPGSAEFLRADYLSALSRLKDGPSFDILYIDPPYESDFGAGALRRLGELAFVKEPHARVVVEHASKSPPPEAEGNLRLLRRYPYGNSSLSFYAGNHEN